MEENNSNQEKRKGLKPLNKTNLLVAGLVLLTAVLLIISLTSQNPINLPGGSKDIKTGFANTSLAFSQTPRVGTSSGIYEMDINIDSKDNKVTGAQLELTYDPKVLENVDIRPGGFLDNPVVIVKSVDETKGIIKFWLGNRIEEPGIKGDGTIAVISFSKLGAGQTQINFLPKTSISAEGIDQSVLRQTISAIISLPGTRSGTFLSPTKTP